VAELIVVGILRPDYFQKRGMLDVSVRMRSWAQPRRRWVYQGNDRPLELDEELLALCTDDEP